MSIRLPFKPIFAIDYDQDLLSTVSEQVKKHVKSILDQTNEVDAVPGAIEESIQEIVPSELSKELFFELCLQLYFLERSLVKASQTCLEELMTGKISSEDLSSLIQKFEDWPNDKVQILNVYKLTKGSEKQKVIQLTDKVYDWINSFIPIEKKHEFKLFNNKFHTQHLITSEGSITTELDIQEIKKYLMKDQTKSITELEQKLLDNINDNKLSVIKVDKTNFDVKQFLYYFIQTLLDQNRQVLVQEIDYFKSQFAELFNRLNYTLIISLDTKIFSEQYEFLNSLRNTPSIVLISESSWNKFESMNLFTKEIDLFVYPKKNLTDQTEKMFLKDLLK